MVPRLTYTLRTNSFMLLVCQRYWRFRIEAWYLSTVQCHVKTLWAVLPRRNFLYCITLRSFKLFVLARWNDCCHPLVQIVQCPRRATNDSWCHGQGVVRNRSLAVDWTYVRWYDFGVCCCATSVRGWLVDIHTSTRPGRCTVVVNSLWSFSNWLIIPKRR